MKKKEPLTLRVLRVLYEAKEPLTRAQLIQRTKVDPATEITRPLRDLRKMHIGWREKLAPDLPPPVGIWREISPCGRLKVPCVRNTANQPSYFLTDVDRAAAAKILGIK